MPTILAINPNTSSSVSILLSKQLGNACPSVDWRMASGRFGARYIVSEAAYAIASHSALDAWAEHSSKCDAVLLACFGDPGLYALRELSPVPVVGLAEAAMRAAAARSSSFSIVTGGPRWEPMLQRLALWLGMSAQLASIRTIHISGGQAASDPDRAVLALAQACRDAQQHDGAGAVILGGAGFAGLAAQVESASGIAVIDSVTAGAKAAEQLALGAPCPYVRRIGGHQTESIGISPALADRLVE